MKDETLYLEHILECINKINTYVKAGKSSFEQVTLIQDGVISNLEIIGEATKRLSMDFREKYPAIPWKAIAGFRDILVHDYMGVDLDIVWEVIEKDLPALKELVIELTQS